MLKTTKLKTQHQVDYLFNLFVIVPQGWNTVKGMHVVEGFNQKADKPVFTQYTNDINLVLKSIKYHLDYYSTMNTTKYRSRKQNLKKGAKLINNIAGLNGIWVDIDFHNLTDSELGEHKQYIIQQITDIIEVANIWYHNQLLLPSYVIDSGHGIYFLYLFKNQIQVNNLGMLRLWKKLENAILQSIDRAISEIMNGNFVDMSANDPLRLLRIPSTNNYRNPNNPVKCELAKTDYQQGFNYDFWNLVKSLLPARPKRAKKHPYKKDKANKPIINYQISKNQYTLNYSRCMDLKKLIDLRANYLNGCRENLLFIYACCDIRITDIAHLENDLIEVNNMFSEKLNYSEVHNLVREMKYLNDQEIYKFKNSKIIEMLNISQDEQAELKSIISNEVKINRRRAKRNQISKANGAKAKKEQRNKQIIKLSKHGSSYRSIAKQLNIGLSTVYRVLSK